MRFGGSGHGRAGRAAVRRERRVDVEHEHVLGALAERVRDAVHAGVAAADHDHVLALGADHAARAASARPGGPPTRATAAVALVEVVHREVHAGELAAGHVEVAVHARADRDHDRVVAARAARSALDVAAHVDVALEVARPRPRAASRGGR